MNSLGPDGVQVPWTQRAGGDQVDRPAEGGLELVGERDEVEADLGVDVDEDVDVASIGLVAARKRAEGGQVAHAEAADKLWLHRPEGGDDLVARSNHEEASQAESQEGGPDGRGAFVALGSPRSAAGIGSLPVPAVLRDELTSAQGGGI